MKERPILFSAPMVRAILAGNKTATRRVVKPQPDAGSAWSDAADLIERLRVCPYGQPGDRLWVRETWCTDSSLDAKSPREFCRWPVQYLADGAARTCGALYGNTHGKTRASIHMPRWASRLTLEITGVRAERLQDISEADVLAEGFMTREGGAAFNYAGTREYFIPEQLERDPTGSVAAGGNVSAQQAFRELFESINGPTSWNANPWVWVVEFKRINAEAA